uniref:Myb-like domain-containing protein n=1 Tax=Aegilops tauschii subsp. strangulata TaxID=200361 RepID=A0A453Q0E0_AEGTS
MGLAMPPPCARRLAAHWHWVVDALAGDEALDFSLIKALVGASPEPLAGAPEATRERLALRCLREVAAQGEAPSAAAAAAAGGRTMLRVDAARSCEELLLELLGQVGSSGSLEKDTVSPFINDIQKFICTKTPVLPETSFELLREVNPEIASMVPPSPVEQGGKNNGNDQLFCSISPDHVNTERHRCHTDSSDFQRQKDPMERTPDLHEPSRLYNRPQEDTIGVSVRSAQTSPSKDSRNTSITAEPTSASCSADLLRSKAKLMSKQDAVETTMSQEKSPTAILQRESCGDKYRNPCHDNDGERPHGDDTNIHLSKNLSHEGLTMQAMVAPDSDRTNALRTNTSETNHLPEFVAADVTGVMTELHGRKTQRNSPQHDSGETAVQVRDEGSAGIQPVEKDPGHNELNLQTAGVVPSVSCNRAVQGDKSETNLQQENATGHSKIFEEKNDDKAHLEVSCADKANPALLDDVNILENNTSGGRQTALDSPCCNVPSSSQDKDANGSIKGLTEQDLCIKCGKDGQLLKCSSCSLAAHDGCFGSPVTFDASGQFHCPVCFYTKATEAYQKAKNAYLEARKNLSSFLGTKQFPKLHEQSTGKQQTATNSKDQLNECNTSKRQGNHQSEADNLSHMDEEPSLQRNKQRTNDTSVACPEDQLNGCNTSERQGNHQSEADNLSHKDEEPGEQRKKQKTNDTSDACPEEDQLNGCNTPKRQGNNKSDAYNLSHKDLEPGQQRKKQKTNATSDACREDVVTEKASFGLNSNIAPNKDSVLQNKRKQVHVTEHEQSVENAEAHEDGNNNSFCEPQHSSQNRCSPVVNQNVEADKHVSLTNSHECESSDEIEATSSNDSGKQSSPPWRNMRHRKAKFQEKETVVSENSKKALGCQDQHMPSPSRKRNCNPLAPAGRRSKLCWTEEEEQALRDAMLKFTPKDDELIPWIQILEYGRNVFHKARLPSDLRVKWRNMKKKSES